MTEYKHTEYLRGIEYDWSFRWSEIGQRANFLINNFSIGSHRPIMKWGNIMKHFGLSCVCVVYFLCNSTYFHDIRTECQIIFIHFLLFISNILLGITRRCPLPYFIPTLLSLIAIDIATQLMVYIKRR